VWQPAGVWLVVVDTCVRGELGSEVRPGIFGFKLEGVGLGGVLGKGPVVGLMWFVG